MKRQNGNTTRTIDNAIQVLFKTGAIKVPFTLNLEECRAWDLEQIILDPACQSFNASVSTIQQYLLMGIKRRLDLEHKGVNFEFRGNIIRIKE